MKKILSIFISLLVLTAVILSGCTASTPSSPAATATATATPVTAASGVVFESFTDSNLSCTIGALTGTWSSGNDSASGGTSSISSFGIVTDSEIQLGVTATVQTSIDLSSGGFASQIAYNSYGYVYIQFLLDGPLDLTANNPNGFQYYIYQPLGSQMDYRLYVYDANGNSCWSVFSSMPLTRIGTGFSFTMSVAPGSSYTAADILSAAVKFQWVFRHRGYGAVSNSVSVIIDGFGVY